MPSVALTGTNFNEVTTFQIARYPAECLLAGCCNRDIICNGIARPLHDMGEQPCMRAPNPHIAQQPIGLRGEMHCAHLQQGKTAHNLRIAQKEGGSRKVEPCDAIAVIDTTAIFTIARHLHRFSMGARPSQGLQRRTALANRINTPYPSKSMDMTRIITQPHPNPVAATERAERIANPGFGKIFTDHMVIARYVEGKGWGDAELTARAPLSIDPACAVLHYAQEIFEGLKAYRHADGAMALFRPDANAARFNQSATRMAMPHFPEDVFVDACKAIARIDAAWFPPVDGGSLYLRPFMFASEVFLGVKPSNEYLFIVLAAASGGYFKPGASGINLLVSDHDSRSGPGGTGAAKCGGNYAASLRFQAESIARGYDQIVFLDAVERRYVEELGGMNLFFVFDDGSILTPPLDGCILPGITRDSILTLARDKGLRVREERYSIDAWRADAVSGKLRETFACGTAAVVTPVASVSGDGFKAKIGAGATGQLTEALRSQLVAIQRGTAADPYGWVQRID